MRSRFRDLAVAIVFLIALAFFVQRGPYRAIRYSTTGDFATVYGAARCWLDNVNPYEPEPLKRQLAQTGAPPSLQADQDVNPSVYLPSALLLVAAIAWLPWTAANTLWCLLSLALWALALWRVLQQVSLAARAKWLIAAAALLFSPSYVGVYDGNPSVIAISLVVLAIYAQNWRNAAILLAVVLCFKPQIAPCAICILLVRKQWRAFVLAAALFGAVLIAASARNWTWWHTEQRNITLSFGPGGQSNPAPRSHVAWQFLNAQTLASYAASDGAAVNYIVWAIGAALAGLFFVREKRSDNQAVAFFAAWTLLLTYHRYYDAQLLLLAIPFLVELARVRALIVAACLLVLAFPLQSVFARKLGPEARIPSLKQALLLRNQPFAVLVLTLVFALPPGRKQEL